MNKALTLRINGARAVKLSFVKDLPDGNLFIAEARREIPFDIKRVYFVNNLANPKATRGKHAHRNLEQVLFCISGSFLLHLDDSKVKQRVKLNDAAQREEVLKYHRQAESFWEDLVKRANAD